MKIFPIPAIPACLGHMDQVDHAHDPFHFLSMHRTQEKDHGFAATVFPCIRTRIPGCYRRIIIGLGTEIFFFAIGNGINWESSWRCCNNPDFALLDINYFLIDIR